MVTTRAEFAVTVVVFDCRIVRNRAAGRTSTESAEDSDTRRLLTTPDGVFRGGTVGIDPDRSSFTSAHSAGEHAVVLSETDITAGRCCRHNTL